jgi:polar amino acid transport system substrate-binding protein
VGTDNPAYPPYFKGREGGNTPPWDPSQGDPTTGKGFESAVAYAVAGALGFSADKVTWVVVPFSNSFAPGAKKFDFDINQVSYTPERAQAADLSDGYYFGNQTVVTLQSSSFAKATSITALQSAKLGAQVGTTSYDAIVNVIMPTNQPQVYDSNDAAIQALKNKQIDAILVDLPTADFITNVQLANSVIVGQLAQGTPEHFSAVLAKDSPLTPCVNEAIAVLTMTGTLQQLANKWLPFNDTPVLTP